MGYHRIIIGVSRAFGAVGLALGIMFWIVILTSAKDGDIKTWREAIGILLLPAFLGLLGLAFGVAVSCLFAPREFLLGPDGQNWMKAIGTQSLVVARLVCFLVVLVLGGLPLGMGLLCWLAR